jgi:predicted CxxxxCH...CXXCH cytochrome family protein
MRARGVLVLLGLVAGCDDEVFGEKPTDDVVSDLQGWCGVQAVFASRCETCHGSSATGGLDLATDPAAALIGVAAATDPALTLVVAGDPEASFLWHKVSGDLAPGQGGVMPPAGLDTAEQELIRAWIADGASTTCDEEPTTDTPDSYHPEGFGAAAVHGAEAKQQTQACTDCHGADLAGDAGPSCDTCHDEGWRENCSFCHGDAVDGSGAPPRHISGVDDGADATFIPHLAHVLESDLHVAWDCTTCHTKPSNVLSDGHLFIGDVTPGRAEVDFSQSLSAAASWDGNGTCSNLYCHGNGRGNNGTMAHDGVVDGCDDCHGSKAYRGTWRSMSGEHEEHLDEGVDCVECHQDTVGQNDASIVDPARHVNGVKDVALPNGMTRNANGTCTGTCHGERHTNRGW